MQSLCGPPPVRKVLCLVGMLRQQMELPRNPLTLDGKTIAEHFAEGSRRADGAPGIDLTVDTDHLGDANLPAGAGTSIPNLQSALGSLVIGQSETRKVPRIGLLFADSFAPKDGVLGIMFDEGFTPGTPGEPSEEDSIPREGCAVFLDAVAELRKAAGQPTIADEALFTAIHELGHVFNLWHVRDPLSFMAQSSTAGVYGSAAHRFLGTPSTNPVPVGSYLTQREFLSRCDDLLYVRPTESPFGIRGTYGPPHDDPPQNITSGAPPVRVELTMARREFWNFEPVELDVRVELRQGRDEPFRMPDVIDPGYEAFTLFIDDPDGTRRRYRPEKRFCAPPGELVIAAGQPFDRDLSIFGQAGSYTFAAPGSHWLSVRLRVPGYADLWSDPIEVHVRGASPGSRQFTELRDLLTVRRFARFAFYRSHPLRPDDERRVAEACRRRRAPGASAALLYALGRSLTSRTGRRRGPASRQRGLEYLRRAQDSAGLGRRARQITRAVLEGG
ncbi:MAG: hypothetical protein K8T90_15660 [Planctomycetes bacterium]|nr:hypothetical protein [Planctomycetota bacterium]